jgi:hypothetical protein
LELSKIYFWIGNSIVIVAGIVLITKIVSSIDTKVGGEPSFVLAAKRNHNVLLDADLAELYRVHYKVFLQAEKRNLNRFSSDFMFQLDAQEWQILRLQSATSRLNHGGWRYAPYALIERGGDHAVFCIKLPAVDRS